MLSERILHRLLSDPADDAAWDDQPQVGGSQLLSQEGIYQLTQDLRSFSEGLTNLKAVFSDERGWFGVFSSICIVYYKFIVIVIALLVMYYIMGLLFCSKVSYGRQVFYRFN